MKYLFGITSIVLFTALFGCRPEPLEIDIDPIEIQTVVFSQVIPNQVMTIALTKTIDALQFSEENGDETSNALIEKLLVEDAKVTISYRDIVDTLLAVTPGIYIGVQTPQYTNEDYTLRVETTEGQILTSTTKMLPKVIFSSIAPTVEIVANDTTISVDFKITDLAEDNWYMLNFYKPQSGNTPDTGLDLNSFFTDQNNVLIQTTLLSDEIFESNAYEGTVVLENISSFDSLVVTLSNINEDYYKFLELHKRSENVFSVITKEPITSPTNIVGGLGFFNTHFPDIVFFDLKDY